MSHYITKLSVQNFKSCRDLSVDLTEFVPLVGYNNAGKSNVLSALEWLFKDRLLSSSDFNDPVRDIVVEGEIVGVDEAILARLDVKHRRSIEGFVVDEKIRIRRTQSPDATKKGDIELSVYHPGGEYRSNPAGIWNAIKQLFPEPIRIAAMDNAAEDATKAKTTSTIGKLLAEFCTAVRQKNAGLIDRHLGAISRRLGADGNRRLPELNTIDNSINTKIEELFPGISLKLHFEIPTFEELFKSGTVKIYEGDDVARDFTAYGHGAQRSVQMALVRHLAEVKRGIDSPTTTLLLIDEPELYLHPFAIEQVREALPTLSKNGYQIVFSTHSAQMITADRAQHTLLIRKTADQGTYARKRLQDALNIVLPNAVAQSQHLFALSQSSSVLFANRVILTEGKTELRLLPHIYKLVSGYTLGQHQLAMVETGSVDSISKTLSVLHEMDIPALAIVDLDYAFRGGIRNGFVTLLDEPMIKLLAMLRQMEVDGICALNGGLPTSSNSPISAAKAFELLAAKVEAVPYIAELHEKLLDKNIWLWKSGAIEAHLGLADKSEAVWAAFKISADTLGLEASCADFASVRDLSNWIGRV
ncbi:ATP-dependent nuclease [Pseudomonas syringae]|uniref:ATP-dependent nuclease n=1 Tax=Pseudomonas syringae TaxID=317 RepID=UPI003F766E7D